MAELARDLDGTRGTADTAEHAVRAALETIPSCSGAGLTLLHRDGTLETIAATDDAVLKGDRLQYELGEGPCLEITDTGGWLRSGDVGTDARYPTWGPRAAELGVTSLLSLAVTDPDGPLGALNLYSEEAGGFADRDVVDLALVW